MDNDDIQLFGSSNKNQTANEIGLRMTNDLVSFPSPDKQSLRLFKNKIIEDSNYSSNDQNRLITDNESNKLLYEVRRKESKNYYYNLSSKEPLNSIKSHSVNLNVKNNKQKKVNYNSNYDKVYKTLKEIHCENDFNNCNKTNNHQDDNYNSNYNSNSNSKSNFNNHKSNHEKFNLNTHDLIQKEIRSLDFPNDNNNKNKILNKKIFYNNNNYSKVISGNDNIHLKMNIEIDPLERYNQYIKTAIEKESKRKKDAEENKIDLKENHEKKISFLEESSSKTKSLLKKNNNSEKANNNNYNNTNNNHNRNKNEASSKIKTDNINENKGANKQYSLNSRNNYKILNKDNNEILRNFDNLGPEKYAAEYNHYNKNEIVNYNYNHNHNRDRDTNNKITIKDSIRKEPAAPHLIFSKLKNNKTEIITKKKNNVKIENSKLDFDLNENSINSFEIVKNTKLEKQNHCIVIEKPGTLLYIDSSNSPHNFIRDPK